MNGQIETIDDVLEPHYAELIHEEMKKLYWKYDYNSRKGQVNKHWHILCGNTAEECEQNGFYYVNDLFKALLQKIGNKHGVTSFKRAYMNAHTHGVEPHIHKDDGDFTFIYYPIMDWRTEWGGGTAIFNVEDDNPKGYLERVYENGTKRFESAYKGNRLLMFDASLPHQAQPVSRECYTLRSVIVFKTYIESANPSRLEFYS